MKKIIIILLSLFLVSCSVTIEDPALTRAIDRQRHQKSKSYEEITTLDVSFLGVESLVGIERLENLEVLTLSNNLITDLKPLESLKNLKVLDIQNNRVKDLTPLVGMEHLEVLLIRNNPVESIEVIDSLFSKLRTTDFLVNVSFDDQALDQLVRENLGLEGVQLSYYDLEKLRSLDLSSSQVKDLSGLEHAKGLEELILDKAMGNLEVISELKNLKKLSLSNMSLSDISFIKDLSKLEYLDVSYNNLTDIAVIEDMDQLNYLNIKRNKISDVSVIKSPKLKSLFIESNYVADYEEIPVLDQIQETDIIIVYFNDPLLDEVVREQVGKKGVVTRSDLKNMKRLIAPNYGIKSLGGIELLEGLIELDLTGNNITDISPLESLSGLQVLKLKNNGLSDITPLIYLDNINILDLSINDITTIEALTYLPKLEYLYLEGNDIEDNSIKEDIKSKLKATDEW